MHRSRSIEELIPLDNRMGAKTATKIGHLHGPWLSPEMEQHTGQSKINSVHILEVRPISITPWSPK
jgi:hypothetical protein